VELAQWSFLVAAAGHAMLRMLPQLADGCINYWEAGNWALNAAAEPPGPKTARDHRRVHLHLLGRSRTAADPAWRWGEAPKFPDFARQAWATKHERLASAECRDVVIETERLLHTRYNLQLGQLAPWEACAGCAYPMVTAGKLKNRCAECGDQTLAFATSSEESSRLRFRRSAF
jgi:hypothetical protein